MDEFDIRNSNLVFKKERDLRTSTQNVFLSLITKHFLIR